MEELQLLPAFHTTVFLSNQHDYQLLYLCHFFCVPLPTVIKNLAGTLPEEWASLYGSYITLNSINNSWLLNFSNHGINGFQCLAVHTAPSLWLSQHRDVCALVQYQTVQAVWWRIMQTVEVEACLMCEHVLKEHTTPQRLAVILSDYSIFIKTRRTMNLHAYNPGKEGTLSACQQSRGPPLS